MYENRKLSVCSPKTSNRQHKKPTQWQTTLHLCICVANEHVPMTQCFLETWTEQGVWKSRADGTFGILIALGAVDCIIIRFGVLRVDMYLPLSLQRATAGFAGTPSRHHVIRDVRCCMVGAQAVGSQIQALIETLTMFCF